MNYKDVICQRRFFLWLHILVLEVDRVWGLRILVGSPREGINEYYVMYQIDRPRTFQVTLRDEIQCNPE